MSDGVLSAPTVSDAELSNYLLTGQRPASLSRNTPVSFSGPNGPSYVGRARRSLNDVNRRSARFSTHVVNEFLAALGRELLPFGAELVDMDTFMYSLQRFVAPEARTVGVGGRGEVGALYTTHMLLQLQTKAVAFNPTDELTAAIQNDQMTPERQATLMSLAFHVLESVVLRLTGDPWADVDSGTRVLAKPRLHMRTSTVMADELINTYLSTVNAVYRYGVAWCSERMHSLRHAAGVTGTSRVLIGSDTATKIRRYDPASYATRSGDTFADSRLDANKVPISLLTDKLTIVPTMVFSDILGSPADNLLKTQVHIPEYFFTTAAELNNTRIFDLRTGSLGSINAKNALTGFGARIADFPGALEYLAPPTQALAAQVLSNGAQPDDAMFNAFVDLCAAEFPSDVVSTLAASNQLYECMAAVFEHGAVQPRVQNPQQNALETVTREFARLRLPRVIIHADDVLRAMNGDGFTTHNVCLAIKKIVTATILHLQSTHTQHAEELRVAYDANAAQIIAVVTNALRHAQASVTWDQVGNYTNAGGQDTGIRTAALAQAYIHRDIGFLSCYASNAGVFNFTAATSLQRAARVRAVMYLLSSPSSAKTDSARVPLLVMRPCAIVNGRNVIGGIFSPDTIGAFFTVAVETVSTEGETGLKTGSARVMSTAAILNPEAFWRHPAASLSSGGAHSSLQLFREANKNAEWTQRHEESIIIIPVFPEMHAENPRLLPIRGATWDCLRDWWFARNMNIDSSTMPAVNDGLMGLIEAAYERYGVRNVHSAMEENGVFMCPFMMSCSYQVNNGTTINTDGRSPVTFALQASDATRVGVL